MKSPEGAWGHFNLSAARICLLWKVLLYLTRRHHLKQTICQLPPASLAIIIPCICRNNRGIRHVCECIRRFNWIDWVRKRDNWVCALLLYLLYMKDAGEVHLTSDGFWEYRRALWIALSTMISFCYGWSRMTMIQIHWCERFVTWKRTGCGKSPKKSALNSKMWKTPQNGRIFTP